MNFGSSPVSISANTTIAKIVFLALDSDANHLIDSTPFQNYDVMIDGLAAQTSQSFLRIAELVPDLSEAAKSAVAAAQLEIQSYSTQSVDQMRGTLAELRKETFLKTGGGFAAGFILAVVFALWIFPSLRDIDIESASRIKDIVSEQNSELMHQFQQLKRDFEALETGERNGN